MKRRGAGFIMAGLILCCMACGSMHVIEKGGQVLDGSIFAEKTLAVYQLLVVGREDPAIELRQVRSGKDKQEALVITMDAFPVLRFRGSAPAGDGDFQLQSMHFLGGNPAGWNEFTLELVGSGVFTTQENRGILQIQPSIEPVRLSSGKIRHKENRFTGDQALTGLRNRYERIIALTDWMHTLQDVPRFETQGDFEDYWKPRLLPEIVALRNRPAGFTQENAVWVRAEDIKWNTAYTESFFPEELWVLRNSGALLRDWEEVAAWIYVQYQWDYIVELMSDRYTLRKIK